MDFAKILFSPNGRIGRQEFWIGFLILIVAWKILLYIPVVGWLLDIAMIYCWVCLDAKRLHDMGKSGWLVLVPILIGCIAGAAIVASIGMTVVTSLTAAGADNHLGPEGIGAIIAAGGMGMIAFFGSCLAWLVFVLWIGISNGTPGDNAYGPAPSATTPVTPAAS